MGKNLSALALWDFALHFGRNVSLNITRQGVSLRHEMVLYSFLR